MSNIIKSNRMRKAIFIGVAIYLGILLLLRSLVPQKDFVQTEITDTKLSVELKDAAKIALKDYFEIELDETKPWETMIVHNAPNEQSTLPPVYSVMQESPSEGLPENEVYSYGVAMREDTREVVSIFYTQVSNAEIKDLSDEEIQKSTIKFLQENEISEGDELKVTNIQRSKDSEIVSLIMEGYGEKYSVAYNLRIDKVTYFDKAEIVNSSHK